MEKDKILEDREKYYSNIAVKFELIKQLKAGELTKELTILDDKSLEKRHFTRFIYCTSISYLEKHFQRFEVLLRKRNLYHSVSNLKNLPIFSYNLVERRKTPEYISFNKNYKDFVKSYDFFCDMDGKENYNQCFQEMLKLKTVFDKYQLPYYIVSSSFKGFHMIIEAKYMPIYTDINELITKINEIQYNLSGIYSLKTLDLSVGDIKRVKKLPYSAVGDGSVALPLDDFQISNFQQSMISIPNVLANISIRNRGLLVRNLNVGQEQLKKNVLNFIQNFE
jgi:hypothetical protein